MALGGGSSGIKVIVYVLVAIPILRLTFLDDYVRIRLLAWGLKPLDKTIKPRYSRPANATAFLSFPSCDQPRHL